MKKRKTWMVIIPFYFFYFPLIFPLSAQDQIDVWHKTLSERDSAHQKIFLDLKNKGEGELKTLEWERKKINERLAMELQDLDVLFKNLIQEKQALLFELEEEGEYYQKIRTIEEESNAQKKRELLNYIQLLQNKYQQEWETIETARKARLKDNEEALRKGLEEFQLGVLLLEHEKEGEWFQFLSRNLSPADQERYGAEWSKLHKDETTRLKSFTEKIFLALERTKLGSKREKELREIFVRIDRKKFQEIPPYRENFETALVQNQFLLWENNYFYRRLEEKQQDTAREFEQKLRSIEEPLLKILGEWMTVKAAREEKIKSLAQELGGLEKERREREENLRSAALIDHLKWEGRQAAVKRELHLLQNKFDSVQGKLFRVLEHLVIRGVFQGSEEMEVNQGGRPCQDEIFGEYEDKTSKMKSRWVFDFSSDDPGLFLEVFQPDSLVAAWRIKSSLPELLAVLRLPVGKDFEMEKGKEGETIEVVKRDAFSFQGPKRKVILKNGNREGEKFKARFSLINGSVHSIALEKSLPRKGLWKILGKKRDGIPKLKNLHKIRSGVDLVVNDALGTKVVIPLNSEQAIRFIDNLKEKLAVYQDSPYYLKMVQAVSKALCHPEEAAGAFGKSGCQVIELKEGEN